MRELCVTSYSTFKATQENPSPVVVDNLKFLAEHVLQPLRDHIMKPLTINSGYRSSALNNYVKGAKNSYHLYGCAADIKMDNWEMAYRCAAFVTGYLIPFNECIICKLGPTLWLHVAFRRGDTKHYVGFKEY